MKLHFLPENNPYLETSSSKPPCLGSILIFRNFRSDFYLSLPLRQAMDNEFLYSWSCIYIYILCIFYTLYLYNVHFCFKVFVGVVQISSFSISKDSPKRWYGSSVSPPWDPKQDSGGSLPFETSGKMEAFWEATCWLWACSVENQTKSIVSMEENSFSKKSCIVKFVGGLKLKMICSFTRFHCCNCSALQRQWFFGGGSSLKPLEWLLWYECRKFYPKIFCYMVWCFRIPAPWLNLLIINSCPMIYRQFHVFNTVVF